MTTTKILKGFLVLVVVAALLVVGLTMFSIAIFGQTAERELSGSYVGAGFGFEHSTNYFGGTNAFFDIEGRKEFGKNAVTGLAKVHLNPPYTSMWQGDGGKRPDGYQVDVEGSYQRNIYRGIYLGAGLNYSHQSFPNEFGGKAAHFHSVLQPTASAGIRFGSRFLHAIEYKQIFEEPKIKDFTFNTIYSKGYYDPEDGDIYNVGDTVRLTTAGLFSPSYQRGRRIVYELTRRHSGHWAPFFRVSGEVMQFRKCQFTGRGIPDFQAYCADYRERDQNVTVSLGLRYFGKQF
jgi:hypothetical protein